MGHLNPPYFVMREGLYYRDFLDHRVVSYLHVTRMRARTKYSNRRAPNVKVLFRGLYPLRPTIPSCASSVQSRGGTTSFPAPNFCPYTYDFQTQEPSQP